MNGRAVLRGALLGAALACLVATLAIGGRASWLDAKATLAQRLLERAWTTTLAGGVATRPWPWADVRSVARLEVPAHGVSLVVLGDASGEALAFGPGLVAGDPARAARGTLALGGHRDTHLAFLARVAPGDEFLLHGPDGAVHAYVAGRGHVVDVRRETLALDPNVPGLVLITCWPFDAPRAGGPLRWVVEARATSGGVTGRTAARRDAPAVVASAQARLPERRQLAGALRDRRFRHAGESLGRHRPSGRQLRGAAPPSAPIQSCVDERGRFRFEVPMRRTQAASGASGATIDNGAVKLIYQGQLETDGASKGIRTVGIAEFGYAGCSYPFRIVPQGAGA